MILLCFILTISTAFEYQLKSKDLSVDRSGKPCKKVHANLPIQAKENNEKFHETVMDDNQNVTEEPDERNYNNGSESSSVSVESLIVKNLMQQTMLNNTERSREDYNEMNNSSRTSNVSCHDVSIIDKNASLNNIKQNLFKSFKLVT